MEKALFSRSPVSRYEGIPAKFLVIQRFGCCSVSLQTFLWKSYIYNKKIPCFERTKVICQINHSRRLSRNILAQYWIQITDLECGQKENRTRDMIKIFVLSRKYYNFVRIFSFFFYLKSRIYTKINETRQTCNHCLYRCFFGNIYYFI